ncbi:MAG: TonB-dependent receptor [Prevotella sp.]|nr:TonB-dependent receptor [Prevotella sp.]
MKESNSFLRQFSVMCRSVATLLALIVSMYASAQNIKVYGVVTDASTGEEIIGATVQSSNKSTATVTDLSGAYQITVQAGQTLRFSYVGYKPQSVTIRKSGKMDVRLEQDENVLDQVVVVGYGVMKRSDLTGAVGSITEEQIKQGVNTSIEQAMQGRIAGVQVTQNSGAPGGGISVQVRGVNSLNGNEPLYVVDGIAMSGQTGGNQSVLSTLNPSDITSIEVLKDASATAIYGSRASNGVVLITTKRGEEGKTKIQYEGYVGWQQLPSKLEVMNLHEYADYYNVRANIMGWGVREDFLDPSALTTGTDWQDELFRSAFMHNHQVSVSGGTKSTNYAVSGGYLNQDGIALGSSFDRVSVRVNLDTEITKWLKVGASGYFAKTKQVTTLDTNGLIDQALNQRPDVAPKNPDGTYGFVEKDQFNTYYTNPLFEAQMKENYNKGSQLDYNFYANVTPLKGLTLRVEYGGSRNWHSDYSFTPDYTYGTVVNESYSWRQKSDGWYESFKQYATYDTDLWKGHHLQVMAGHETQESHWENLSGSRKNFINSTIHNLNVGDASTAKNNNDGGGWAIESYYGRLNYNLLDRYLLTATIRTDGSSNLGRDKRWGTFPSAAFAWRISNEPFMKKFEWINNLKLRLGWGIVGNQNAGSYAYGTVMKNSSTAWGTGYYPGNYSNPKMKWEETKAYNVGIDLSLFNNRVELMIDAYYKTTDNLLMTASLPAYIVDSEYVGLSAPWVNVGALKNKGIEFTLNTVNITMKDFQWRSGLTLSFNRNEITKLYTDDSTILGRIGDAVYTLSEIGQPVGQFYGYNVIGMFTCEDDFYQKDAAGNFLLDEAGDRIAVARPAPNNGDMYPIAPNSVWVGDYIFEDVNGDGKITEQDRKIIGNPNPDFTFGLNNTLTYKDFELSFFLTGSVGNDVYNVLRQWHTDPLGWGNKMKEVRNYARIGLIDPDGSDDDISNVVVTNAETASVQRVSAAGMSNNDNNRISSRFVENGSYLRMKSLSLAWNLPKSWLKKIDLDWVQVYANVQNLFTITSYSGYDPEVGAMAQDVLRQGLDSGRYPSQRIYNVGLKVRF